MQLIEIVGPPASGKTTVMRALQRLTSFEAYAFVEEAAATDELAKHAVSEGTKAVTKYTSNA